MLVRVGQTEASGDALASYIQGEVAKAYPDVTVRSVDAPFR